MFCKYCGQKLNEGDEFCTNCGAKKDSNSGVQQNINNNQPNMNNNGVNNNPNNMQVPNKTSATAIVSLVLGILSLFLCFFINLFTLPLSITGIILGIITKEKGGMKIAGIILNLLSIIISILIIVFIGALFMTAWDKAKDNIDKYEKDYKSISNPLEGKWNCKLYDGSKEYDYAVTFEFDDDNKFEWYKYEDKANTNVTGDYEYNEVTKSNGIEGTKYYSVEMESESFTNDGSTTTDKYTSKYEFGINSYGDEAVVINEATYNMYYCYME